jgi:hypothetical protein
MPESHLYLKDQIQVYKVQLMHSPTPLGKEPQKDLCHDGVIEDIIRRFHKASSMVDRGNLRGLDAWGIHPRWLRCIPCISLLMVCSFVWLVVGGSDKVGAYQSGFSHGGPIAGKPSSPDLILVSRPRV